MREETARQIERKYTCIIDQTIASNLQHERSHFNHITGTLNLSSSAVRWNYPYYRKSLLALKTYLRLVNNNPEFARGEFTSAEGYFPDIEKSITDRKRQEEFSFHYVTQANKRLTALNLI